MALIQTLMAVGLIIFIGYLVKVTSKPPKFPPGPFKLPLIGSLLCMFMSGSSATPSLLHSFQDVAGKNGSLVGFFLGSYPAVLVSDFGILKDLFKVFCTKMYQSKNANGVCI